MVCTNTYRVPGNWFSHLILYMKITCRFPTEQYAYVEVEYENYEEFKMNFSEFKAEIYGQVKPDDVPPPPEEQEYVPEVFRTTPPPQQQYAPQQFQAPSKFPMKVIGATCTTCGVGKNVQNPKTGKVFCDKKCWLQKAP